MKLCYAMSMCILLSTCLAESPSELDYRPTSNIARVGYNVDLYSQWYDFGLLQNGYSNYSAGNRWVCDDFTLSYDPWYPIGIFYVWMIWTGEHAFEMNFSISEDASGDSNPNTAIEIWSSSGPCWSTFTGDSNWGYDIFETYCVITPGFYYCDEDVHYYLETQAECLDNCYVLVSPNYVDDYCWYDDGSGVWVRSDVVFGQDSDMFFVIDVLLGLDSETWGSIKTLF